MPRPQKPRIICEMPKYSMFGPKGERMSNLKKIELTIDEFETIRLLDHDGYNQEEAAKQMNVARTTVQRIYDIARKKVAESLVEGAALIIEGGEIEMCNEDCERCLGRRKFKHRNQHE